MFDNLQLLFVWAPIINVQVILDGIFVGAVFALCAYGLALIEWVLVVTKIKFFSVQWLYWNCLKRCLSKETVNYNC